MEESVKNRSKLKLVVGFVLIILGVLTFVGRIAQNIECGWSVFTVINDMGWRSTIGVLALQCALIIGGILLILDVDMKGVATSFFSVVLAVVLFLVGQLAAPHMGKLVGDNAWESEYFGLRFECPEDWDMLDKDELKKVKNEYLGAYDGKDEVTYQMMAENDNGSNVLVYTSPANSKDALANVIKKEMDVHTEEILGKEYEIEAKGKLLEEKTEVILDEEYVFLKFRVLYSVKEEIVPIIQTFRITERAGNALIICESRGEMFEEDEFMSAFKPY